MLLFPVYGGRRLANLALIFSFLSPLSFPLPHPPHFLSPKRRAEMPKPQLRPVVFRVPSSSSNATRQPKHMLHRLVLASFPPADDTTCAPALQLCSAVAAQPVCVQFSFSHVQMEMEMRERGIENEKMSQCEEIQRALPKKERFVLSFSRSFPLFFCLSPPRASSFFLSISGSFTRFPAFSSFFPSF